MHARKPSASVRRPAMPYDSRSQPHSLSTAVTKLLPRRTYSPSKVRNFAVMALACVSLVATTFVMHAWLFAPAPAVQLHHQYNLQMVRRDQHDHPTPRTPKYRSDGHQRVLASTSGPAWSFAQHPEMELGAVVAFITLLASNSLPLTIDPSHHIDPELVLGFNTHAADTKVQREVEAIIEDTWTHNPVVIFSELHSMAAPAAREAKTLIGEYHLFPQPTILEVDERVDATVLRPLLRRLTGAEQLPVVIVGGKAFTSIEDLREAHNDGSLSLAITHSAATIDGALLRKKKKH